MEGIRFEHEFNLELGLTIDVGEESTTKVVSSPVEDFTLSFSALKGAGASRGLEVGEEPTTKVARSPVEDLKLSLV